MFPWVYKYWGWAIHGSGPLWDAGAYVDWGVVDIYAHCPLSAMDGFDLLGRRRILMDTDMEGGN